MMTKLFTRYWVLSYSIVMLTGIVWIWISAVTENGTTNGLKPLPRQGYLAPDFQLKNDKGELVSLSDYRGNAVIINFWASWCPPCKAEMPAIERLYQDYSDKGLVILAVNATAQDNIQDVEAFKEDFSLSFSILYDQLGKVNQLYQVTALPTTFFIDSHGVIKDIIIGGPMSEALLRARAEQLIKD